VSPHARPVKTTLLYCCAVLLVGCGATPSPRPTPRATPTPIPLTLGVLPLGGVAAAPLGMTGPYAAGAGVLAIPRMVLAARVPAAPATSLNYLATHLGVPGPPINAGSGLAYNLGASTGYQLTTTENLLDFNFHPNTPVNETGATPSVAAADAFVGQFLAGHQLPGPHEGLIAQPALTQSHAADRRVYFQWSQDGYPVVDITGQPELIYADVAANYRDQLALVGLAGAVPLPVQGGPDNYPAISISQLVVDLNQGLLDPNSYLLQSNDQPFPPHASPSPPSGTTAEFTGSSMAVVDSAGYAVPVVVIQVSGRAPTTEFVMCAAATNACAPLRYIAPTPSPSG